MNWRGVAASLLAAAGLACSTPPEHASSAPSSIGENCAALASLPDVVSANAIASTWTPPEGQGRARVVEAPFCRVELMLEGRVGVEVWLPTADAWNGRLLGAGVGGDAGVFNYYDMARGVEAGFVTASTDSGHKVGERNWMMRRDAVLDYTHRSQHMMNRAARDVIAAYYGRAPHHAYFVGCSGGGRQALKQMQLYPEDYDGVIAGAGGPAMPEMSARHLWQALYQERNPDGAMSDAAWTLVADAAVAACDGIDGVVDGVVENPSRCAFDPAALQCARGQAPATCLTPAQATTVRTFYAPLRDENGRQLDRGLVPGVRTRPGPPSPLLLPVFQQGAHQDLSWTAAEFHIANDVALANRMMPEMRADHADIRAFAARGGRAILYQGWLDPSIIADQSITYWERVRAELGADVADETMRLYLAPGMLHCHGGAGVDEFGVSFSALPYRDDPQRDMLASLIHWVEDDVAPQAIIAARYEQGQMTRTRPLCPYPQEARYNGGDANSAESFQCAMPD